VTIDGCQNRFFDSQEVGVVVRKNLIAFRFPVFREEQRILSPLVFSFRTTVRDMRGL